MRSILSSELSEKLQALQVRSAAAGIPVAVIFEGGSGRVISRIINELCRELEPMGVKYYHFDFTQSGTGPLAGLLNATPAKGEISLYDRSWYSMAVDRYNDDESWLDEALKAINRFETYLMDNGTFVLKILLQVSSSDLKEYASEYRPYTPFHNTFLSVDHIDRVKFNAVFPKILAETDTERAPWHMVKVRGLDHTLEDTAEVIAKGLEDSFRHGWDVPEKCRLRTNRPNPRKGLNLDADSKDYNDRLDELSSEMEQLQIILAESGMSLILAFEGWDAAGKGGAIKHICHALNPRGYHVARIKKPSDEDKDHTHLWRFANHLPSAGHISIFDRTWYGRMMVEPIEGFCDICQYERSAEEINAFERIVSSSGAIIIKFWLDIDKDTQLERFNERRNDPLKQWKLTDEDWRNRDKWDIYDTYVDRMIESTNMPYAPWVVVPANNKKAARVFIMETIIGTLKKYFEEN